MLKRRERSRPPLEERLAALEAEVRVLREWIASIPHVIHVPKVDPAFPPLTAPPWPYSPFTWQPNTTGTPPPNAPAETYCSAGGDR